MSDLLRLVGLPPLFSRSTRILILGSFPSEQSLEAQQYYTNPRNQFWKVMAGVLGIAINGSYETRTDVLLKHGVGLWDVIKSCERSGSLDGSIERPILNNCEETLRRCDSLGVVAFNGQKAAACGVNLRFPGQWSLLPLTKSSKCRHVAVGKDNCMA